MQTVEPLASNPGVQNTVIAAVDAQFQGRIDLKSVLDPVLPPRAAQVLVPPLQGAADSLVNTVTTKFVQSDAFKTLWNGVNRVAHTQINYLLTGQRPKNAAVQVAGNGDVTLDLSAVVVQVKARLVDAGLTVASKVPVVGSTITVGNVAGLQHARSLTNLLNKVANWLPWVGLVLLAVGVLLSRRKRRALVASLLGVVIGLVLVGIGILIGRGIYLDKITSPTLTRDTAQYIFDTVVRYLRLGIRLLALLALLVAFGVWVSGPGEVATRFRAFVVRWPAGARLAVERRAGRTVRGPVRHRAAGLGDRRVGCDPAAVRLTVAGHRHRARGDLRDPAADHRDAASLGPPRPNGGGAGGRRIVGQGHDRWPRAPRELLRDEPNGCDSCEPVPHERGEDRWPAHGRRPARPTSPTAAHTIRVGRSLTVTTGRRRSQVS